MSLRCTIPSDANDPLVTIQQFRDHARADAISEDDADLAIKVNAAIQTIEGETGRVLLESTWEEARCAWPCGDLKLPRMQVQSVTSITYMEAGGTVQTLDPSYYRLVGAYDPATNPKQITYGARVVLKYARYWPVSILERGEPITVTFVAGWDTSDSVPEQLKQAVLLEAASYYRFREAVTMGRTPQQSVPLARGVDNLIARFTDWKF